MQNKPSLCPLLGSALAISRSVAIEEHLRVGAAGTDGIRARAEALVHGEGMPDVGLGVFPATEAGSEEAGRVPVLAMADEDTDAHIDLLGYGCDAGVEDGGGLTVVEIPAAHQRGIFLELDQCQRPCCCRWQATADKPLRRADPVAVRHLLDSTQRLGACALVANRFVSRLSRQQAREPSAVLATA
jgi:hypothetical protein